MEDTNQNAQLIDLKALREEKGLSFKEISDAIGVTENFYRKIERKIVSLTAPIAERISNYYQMKIEPYFIDPKTIEVKHREKKTEEPKKGLLEITSNNYSPAKSLNDVLKKKNMSLAKQLTKLYKTLTDIEQVISDAEVDSEEDLF